METPSNEVEHVETVTDLKAQVFDLLAAQQHLQQQHEQIEQKKRTLIQKIAKLSQPVDAK